MLNLGKYICVDVIDIKTTHPFSKFIIFYQLKDILYTIAFMCISWDFAGRGESCGLDPPNEISTLQNKNN